MHVPSGPTNLPYRLFGNHYSHSSMRTWMGLMLLLCFTRAQRDGSWDLHLYAFKRMLPFLFRYDHVNYARWGNVYLAEMSVLLPEVLHEFQEGNVMVKRTDRRFIQVSADQSTEWLNAIGKKSGITIGQSNYGLTLNKLQQKLFHLYLFRKYPLNIILKI